LSLVLKAELSNFPLERTAAIDYIVKMNGNKNELLKKKI
jgi:hypothetical protein